MRWGVKSAASCWASKMVPRWDRNWDTLNKSKASTMVGRMAVPLADRLVWRMAQESVLWVKKE